jgi:hypothetical protein
MARTPGKRSITAFIVHTDWEGVKILDRCRFMGLKGMETWEFELENVKVPNESIIGGVGKGLKLALVTLNTGRLTVPAMSAASAKSSLEICRKWASTRKQWGQEVGRHDAVAQMLANIAATTFAIEAISDLGGMLADQGGYDIRLEAGMAKLFCTEQGWKMIDDALQVRGGRGYETADSLKNRGEVPTAMERIFRDFRVTRIFEGSSEILRLFIAREALDRHLQVAGNLVEGNLSLFGKLKELPKVMAFYASWYPKTWFGWGRWPKFDEYGELATHVRFLDRTTRKLARTIFHMMARHGAKLQHRQSLMFRAVDVGAELFAMTATIGRARMLVKRGGPEAENATELADVFCRMSRRRIADLFRGMKRNDDLARYKAAVGVLEGKYEWLEKGIRTAWPEGKQ